MFTWDNHFTDKLSVKKLLSVRNIWIVVGSDSILIIMKMPNALFIVKALLIKKITGGG